MFLSIPPYHIDHDFLQDVNLVACGDDEKTSGVIVSGIIKILCVIVSWIMSLRFYVCEIGEVYVGIIVF